MNATGINPCPDLLSLPLGKRPEYLARTMESCHSERSEESAVGGALTSRFLLASLVGMTALGACGPGAGPSTAPSPATEPPAPGRPRAALPSVPLVEGPLAPRVVYPQANQMIASRDSTFVIGSVGNGRATATINGAPVRVWSNGAFIAYVANPPATAPQYEVVAALGRDTARAVQYVRVAGMLPPDTSHAPPPTVVDTTPAWVILGDSVMPQLDTDRVIIGRPAPNDTYRWFFLPGTRVQVTAHYPGYARIRLDSALEVWVQQVDAKTFDHDTTAHTRVAGNATVRSGGGAEWADFVIPIAERVPFFVDEGDRTLTLTLYDTRGNTDLINYPTADSLIRHVDWVQDRNDRAVYTLHLSCQPFGFLVLFENASFILRVRRPPASSSQLPTPGGSALKGVTIAIDPGHPPAGATGPTGLYEADAVLPVGLALKRILEERGAKVVMTRTTRDTVDLLARPVIARQGGAQAFVSLHYNAYPDGMNPFTQINGIETFFYRAHSEPLARAVQLSLDATQPLPDEGVHFRSLAVVRTSWMPAVLVEGGYIILPEQENAMRTPQWQENEARAIADGLEEYFRALRSR
jgi:N-acetylmuramoyl-L-alanine amidase